MEIPAKIRIPLCIEQGSVFNFYIEFGGSKEGKNRYFVVVNRNPKSDMFLIILTSTTQIEKKREFIKKAGISGKTIIEVTTKQYPVFSKNSAFNCNEVFEVKMADLIHKIEEKGSMHYPKLPDEILLLIIDGVRGSPRVSEEIKKLL
jgi:hypothetical protein